MRQRLSFSIILSVFITSFFVDAHARPPKNPGYYQLRVYHYSNAGQEALIDNFLEKTFLPSLHANNLANIGVFKAFANDTAADKRLYVFIPFKSFKHWQKFLQSNINTQVESTGGEYIDAAYNKPAYTRMENILMKAFPFSLPPSASKLTSTKSERVYEFRSYESASEKLHVNKVKMFNEGGEIDIFSRLGFNAVFYGQVIFGAKMPNLMYMTSFENMDARNERWKAFGSDPAWKTLSAVPEYQHNVSKNETLFLRSTAYSDL